MQYTSTLYNNNTSHRHRFIRKSMGSIKSKLVLDIGCGEGAFAVYLSELGAQVCALDQFDGDGSNADFEKVSNKLSQYDILTLKSDFWKVKLPINSFDIVTAIYSLNYFYSADKIISKNRFAKDNYLNAFKSI